MSSGHIMVRLKDIISLIDIISYSIDDLIFGGSLDPNYGLLVNAGYSSPLFSDGFYQSIYSKYYGQKVNSEAQKIWKFIVWLYSVNKLFFIDIYDDVLRFLSEDTASAYNPLLGLYRDHVEHSLDTALIVKRLIDGIQNPDPPLDLGDYGNCWNCIQKLNNYEEYQKTEEFNIFMHWLKSSQKSSFTMLYEDGGKSLDWGIFARYAAFASALVHDIGYSFTRNLSDVVGLLKFRIAFRGSILEYYWGTDRILGVMVDTVRVGFERGLLSGKTVIGLVHPVFSAYILLRRLVKEGNLWVIRNLLSLIIIRHSWQKNLENINEGNITLKWEKECSNNDEGCWPFSCLLYVADELSRSLSVNIVIS